jgi:hypothetical protein
VGTRGELRERFGIGIDVNRSDTVGPLQEVLQHRLVEELFAATEVVVDSADVRAGRRGELADARAGVAALADELLGGIEQGCLGVGSGDNGTTVSYNRSYHSAGEAHSARGTRWSVPQRRL